MGVVWLEGSDNPFSTPICMQANVQQIPLHIKPRPMKRPTPCMPTPLYHGALPIATTVQPQRTHSIACKQTASSGGIVAHCHQAPTCTIMH
jgi:hypothetical protein